MEELYNELTQKAINLMNKSNGNRILIGIAGPPGSGKTTTAKNVCDKINEKQGAKIAAVMPMDGFHFTRNELLKMKNPEYLFKRRGAPFTFNSKALLEKVKELKSSSKTLVTAPSFDHSIKDPQENDIQISSTIKIVILEGNYLLLKDPIWCEISKELNQKWLIIADWEIIKERIIQRHLNAGICSNFDEALERANENDIPNGKYIIENSVKPDFTFRGDIQLFL